MQIKRKLLLFLAGLLAFVVLFYDREPGLNVFIFCLITWLLAGKSLEGYKGYTSDPGFWYLSLSVAVTAGAFTFYGDPGSMLCLFLSFYVLGIYLTDRKFHTLLYPLLLAYSFGSFVVRIFFIDRWIPKRKKWPQQKTAANSENINDDTERQPYTAATESRYMTWIRIWVLPALIATVFLIVYMCSSSMFQDVLIRLLPNLDFPLLFALTLLGFFLLFNFMYILPIPWLYTVNEKVTGWDQGLYGKLEDRQQAAAHQKGAVITLTLLVGLLIAFLFVYGVELYRGIHQNRLSAAVHEQVNSIILSIVMAVAVILYYIRPAESINAKAAPTTALLRKLAFTWIILNSLLVVSAVLHNAAYVERYGLTLLRVGVYIFLSLSLAGLYFTFKKIRQERTAGYLIGIMFRIFFGVIVLNSLVNWSAVITRYNLARMENPDISYLRSLDYNVHVLYPRLKNDPKYKNDLKLQNQIDWQQKDLKDLASKPILSVAWYYKYASWESEKR